MATNNPSKQLFDLLVTKNFDPEMLDSNGRPVENPADTEVFSFDWSAESGNDYGTVVIMLGDDQNLDVYFGDNLGRTMEGDDKSEWFDFLGQLKNFATRNLLSFGTKDLNRLRYSMQSQAAMKESIFESWTGTKTTSWNGRPTEARLMIKHKKMIGENDARFRYIDSLFIETAESERYKLPFKSLTGGKAMLEHVRQGGRPYDARGQHIAEMVTELNVLSRFRRANHGKVFEGDTAQLVEQTNVYYEGLQKTLKGLSKSRGYATYFESWDPQVITEEDATVEGLKHLFVTQSIDQRVEDALPILAKIQQQGNEMKEANIFETWVNNLSEGTWALPDTPEKQQKLVELLSAELPVGPDATNATEQLYDLLGDDELFDQLEALAEKDANADCRQVVYDRMQMLSHDPDVQAVINQVQIAPAPEMNPAPEVDPADIQKDELDEGQMKHMMWELAERLSLEQFLEHFPNDEEFWRAVNDQPAGEESIDEVKDPATQTEDPAGTEEPSYPEYESDLASILKAAGVDDTVKAAPDYEVGPLGVAEDSLDDVKSIGGDASDSLMADIDVNQDEQEMEEGLGGAIAGGALGALAAGPVGAVRGAAIGSELQDTLSDDEEEMEEDFGAQTPAVPTAEEKDSTLSRIKSLAGILVK